MHIELLDYNLFSVFEIEEPIEHEEYDMTIIFYGSHYESGGGVGIMFITPQGMALLISFKLDFECINNNAKYEALILGLKLAIKMKYV